MTWEFVRTAFPYGWMMLGMMMVWQLRLPLEPVPIVLRLSAISALLVLLETMAHGLDVAFTEIAIGFAFGTFLLCCSLRSNDLLGCLAAPAPSWRRDIALWGMVLLGWLSLSPYWMMREGWGLFTPLHVHVSAYYLQDTLRTAGIEGVVTAILASYRGIDTLGESCVIALAAFGVRALVPEIRWSVIRQKMLWRSPELILRRSFHGVMTVGLVAAVYLLFQGIHGPGGAFQAGALWATLLAAAAIVYGLSTVMTTVTEAMMRHLILLGLLAYAVAGLVGPWQGLPLFTYRLDGWGVEGPTAQAWLIEWIECGIALVVAHGLLWIGCLFLALSYASGRQRPWFRQPGDSLDRKPTQVRSVTVGRKEELRWQ
jgi:multicomponent Na+:H+ antiporter subunit B